MLKRIYLSILLFCSLFSFSILYTTESYGQLGQTDLTSIVSIKGDGSYSKVEITLRDNINQLSFKSSNADSTRSHQFIFGKIYRKTHTLTATTYDSTNKVNGTATKTFTPSEREVQTMQNLTITINAAKDGPSTDLSNTCQTADNRDDTFKCMDTACGGEWSTPETRTDPRWFSCSGGRICCKNQAKYNTNYGGGGQPPLQPDTGTTGGGTTPQTTITPVDGTPSVPQGPATGPCAKEKGGVKEYVNAFCNKEPFDAAKAQDGKFCNATYSDKYICNNTDPTTGKPYEDYFEVTSGTSPCSQAPWCPSTSTQPSQSPDAPGCRTQGVTCNNSTPCCVSKNLVCVDPSGSGQFTCQYNTDPSKGPVGAFTPTPGSPSVEDCNTQIANGRASMGCACPLGGGCAPGLACYESADLRSTPDNPNSYFCAPTGARWCHQTQTATTTPLTCTGSPAYSTPTPTPQDKSYQADCPSNPPGQHVCAAAGACPAGYAPKPGGVGNQICSEFSSGQTPTCCVRQTVSANTPTPYATTPPTPTPTRVRQPLVPPSVPDCGADYQTWQSGTPCATATTCYDIYKNSSGASCYKMYSGQTCAHCAQ